MLLDLGEEKAVGGIWNYLGYQNNPKYNVWYWDGQEWIAVFCDAVYEDGTIDSSGFHQRLFPRLNPAAHLPVR